MIRAWYEHCPDDHLWLFVVYHPEKTVVHLWIQYNEREDLPYGGLEFHSREPWHEGQEPSFAQCRFLGGEQCWHMGSTLIATERWAPLWRDLNHDPLKMLAALRGWYEAQIQKEDWP